MTRSAKAERDGGGDGLQRDLRRQPAHGDLHGHGRGDQTRRRRAASIDVSGTTHTAAATYNSDPWSFTGGTELQRPERHGQ